MVADFCQANPAFSSMFFKPQNYFGTGKNLVRSCTPSFIRVEKLVYAYKTTLYAYKPFVRVQNLPCKP